MRIRLSALRIGGFPEAESAEEAAEDELEDEDEELAPPEDDLELLLLLLLTETPEVDLEELPLLREDPEI